MSGVLETCTNSQGRTFSRDVVSWLLNVWQLGTSQGGSVYTREIGKCWKSGLFMPQRASPLAHHKLNSQRRPHDPHSPRRMADSPYWKGVGSTASASCPCPRAPHSVIQQTVL